MKILFAALLISHLTNAQYEWNKGVAVLNDSQVIVGDISFAHDVLLLKENNHVTVFPSHKVASFRFHDAKADINRHYVSVTSKENIFRTPCFYEVVVWGNTSVLRKKRILANSQSNNKEVADFDYYVFMNQKLIPLSKFRTKVYPHLLTRCAFPLVEWVAQHKLNPNRSADAIRIVKWSNKNPYEISMAGL